MKLFLGIDGGRTATTAIIGDPSGRIVGIGRSGPANDPTTDLVTVLREAMTAALTGNKPEFEAACIGFAGHTENQDVLVRETVRAKYYSITNDALVALAGATGGDPGVVTIAGTGSISFGRNAEDRTARAGGWGYAFGDDGSAFDIARQALRAALRYEEGWGAATALLGALIEAGAARSAYELMHRFYAGAFSRARVAAFAPLVDAVARGGDAAAVEILKNAAQALATIASAVRGRLFAEDEIVKVSYAGGAFKSELMLERFRMLIELNGNNRFAAPEYEPAEGALIEAYRIAGLNVKPQANPQKS